MDGMSNVLGNEEQASGCMESMQGSRTASASRARQAPVIPIPYQGNSGRTALLLAARLALGQAQQPRGERLQARLQRIARAHRGCQAALGGRRGRSRLPLPGCLVRLQLLLRGRLLRCAALQGRRACTRLAAKEEVFF